MSKRLVEAIKENFRQKDTKDLLDIWNANDRKSYSDEAFEAIRSILVDRSIDVPQQQVFVPAVKQSPDIQVSHIQQTNSTRFKIGLAFVIVGGLLLLFAISGIFVGCSSSTIEDDYKVLVFGIGGAPVGLFLVLVGGFLCSKVRLRSIIMWVVGIIVVLCLGVLIWLLLSIYNY